MPTNLHAFAGGFAAQVQHVLNTTICNNIHINTVVSPTQPGVIVVGQGLTKTSLETKRFPISIGPKKPRCWMELSYRFCLDEEKTYGTVVSSFFAAYAAAEGDDDLCLCHVDYERNKADGYPEAHIQIYGDSPALRMWPGWDQKRGLNRLHFPVGGRRFRPTLEDFIEFLLRENLVEGRPGWWDVLEKEREAFRRIQLRAAIRRNPEIAIEALQEFGYIP